MNSARRSPKLPKSCVLTAISTRRNRTRRPRQSRSTRRRRNARKALVARRRLPWRHDGARLRCFFNSDAFCLGYLGTLERVEYPPLQLSKATNKPPQTRKNASTISSITIPRMAAKPSDKNTPEYDPLKPKKGICKTNPRGLPRYSG